MDSGNVVKIQIKVEQKLLFCRAIAKHDSNCGDGFKMSVAEMDRLTTRYVSCPWCQFTEPLKNRFVFSRVAPTREPRYHFTRNTNFIITAPLSGCVCLQLLLLDWQEDLHFFLYYYCFENIKIIEYSGPPIKSELRFLPLNHQSERRLMTIL